MPYSIRFNKTIAAPLSSVWQVLADFNNVYTWAPSVTKSGPLNEKNNQIGAGRHCTIKGFGSIEEYITQWQDENSFTYTVSDLGPLTNTVSRWAIHAESAIATRITIEFSYNLKFNILGKVLHKLIMQKKLEKGIADTLNALKNRIETGELVRPLNDSQLSSSIV